MTKKELETVCEEYKTLRHKLEALEEQIKERRAILEAAVAKSEEHKLIVGAFKLTLIECNRENFDLKAAKPVLGDKLIPFIKEIKYTQLRVA